MTDDLATRPRPLSDAEVLDFRELGLTPGNWGALAPLPLLCARSLRRADASDFESFRRLAVHIPGESGRQGESEEFWTRHANFSPPPWALGLFGWHLAHRVQRRERETYLAALDEAAAGLFPAGLISPARPDIARPVREVIEAALCHRQYAHYLPPSRLAPAAEDAGQNLHATAIGERLLTEPTESGLHAIARGLASQHFGERYTLLREFGGWIRKTVPTDDGELIAGDLVDRLRELVEDLLRGSAEGGQPLQSRTAISPRVQSSPLSTTNERVTVEFPDGFAMVPFSDALAQAAEISVARVREWLVAPENARRFLFDAYREECNEVAIIRDPAAVPRALWVIGDLHADVLTLANIIAHADRVAKSEGEPASFVFLGDFVDRGRHDHETLLLLFWLILRDPSRVCIIPGNHDIDLRWDESASRFRVSIEPAEYCERLNHLLVDDHPATRAEIDLARLMIDFWATRPKAVILPDGTMFSHGGFPHTDLHASLISPKSLAEKRCLDDMLWARLSESPKKRPNRGNRGHEFGWKDFSQFCRTMTEVVKVPVVRLVRGHDHTPGRWLLPADYADCPVLTINAMGRRMEGELASTDGPHPFPVMARHVPGELPQLVRLPLDSAEVERAFGRETIRQVVAGIDLLDLFPSGVEVDRPSRTEPPAEGNRGGSV